MPQLAHQETWTEEEYLAFEDESETKHEFLDGNVYAMAGARPVHNFLCGRTMIRLGNILAGRCEVFNSDQRVYVPRPKRFYTYPDGGVVCGKPEHHPKGGDKMVLTNPVLLFEVLSSGTAKYDRGTKLMLYLQIEGLKDVLLIDPMTRSIEHHHRGPRGWTKTMRKRGAVKVLGGIIQVAELFAGLDLGE